jgi:hypothetical protein
MPIRKRCHLAIAQLSAEVALQEFASSRPICVVHNIVAVEDPAGLVAAELHRNTLGNSGPDHIPDGSAAEIVNDNPGDPGLPAGRFPCLSKSTDRLAMIVEHKRTAEAPLLRRPLNDFQKLVPQRQGPTFLIFTHLGTETKFTSRQIDVAPFERHLADPPSRQVEEGYRVFQVAGQSVDPVHDCDDVFEVPARMKVAATSSAERFQFRRDEIVRSRDAEPQIIEEIT